MFKEQSSNGKKRISKNERLEAIKDAEVKMLENINKLRNSTEWKECMNSLSNFHQYSWRNNLLITQQKPEATYVASYNRWKSFNRNVRLGEKAIWICGGRPITKQQEKEAKKQEKEAKNSIEPEAKNEQENNEKDYDVIVDGWSLFPCAVFDISQTVGEPLIKKSIYKTLEGNVENFEKLVEAIRKTTKCEIRFEAIRKTTNGYFSLSENLIVVNSNLPTLHQVKTLLHEICHSILHADEKYKKVCTGEKEFEAESAAYIASKFLGIDTSDFSFGYIAMWSTQEILAKKTSLDRIKKCADLVIQSIEQEFPEQIKICEKEKEQTHKKNYQR